MPKFVSSSIYGRLGSFDLPGALVAQFGSLRDSGNARSCEFGIQAEPWPFKQTAHHFRRGPFVRFRGLDRDDGYGFRSRLASLAPDPYLARRECRSRPTSAASNPRRRDVCRIGVRLYLLVQHLRRCGKPVGL